MEKTKTTSKRSNENEDVPQSNSPSRKRHMSAQPRSMKAATTSVRKALAGQILARAPPKGLANPPREPEIIDLCIDVVAKPIGRPTGGFPRYPDGDVIIDLGMLGDLTYRLHSSTLRRVSPWFSDTLKQLIPECDESFAANFTRKTGICARYELGYNANLSILVLARTTMTKFRLPKEAPVTTTTAITPVEGRPALESPGEKLPANSQKLSSNISSDIPPDTFQSKLDILPTAAPTQSAQVARIDAVAIFNIPETNGTGVHQDDTTSLFVPVQSTIKIEEPQIKQEEESPKRGIPVEKSQVAPHGVTTNILESQVTSKASAAAEDSHFNSGARNNELIKTNNVKDQENQIVPPTDELMAAYKGLFRTYCGQAPVIDKEDINVALQQAEAIIRVAKLYGSVSTVRPYLGNALLQFGRGVCQAILLDPPRWLRLSIYIESSLIFKEAAVHIIGNLGYWPWRTVQLEDLSDDLVTFLKAKIDKLKRLIADVERTLLMTSINVEGEDVQLAPTDKRTINTWYVNQLWKQWFIRAITQDEAPKPTGRADGTKYRAIAQGNDAYLPLETVTEHIKVFREPTRLTRWDKQTIEEDLKMFKIFAQKQVQDLCVNNSMLSAGEAGIEHLTCTTIDGIDISWFTHGALPAED